MSTNLFDLSGKVALITGGSRGLGREMALAFADHGADVIIASRKLEACEAVAREVEARGRRALAVGCHVGRWSELDALVDTALKAFGRIDILVNNAGLSPLYPSLDAITEELFDKVVALNLKGPFRLAALVGTHMAQGNGGSIINVSSTAAVTPSPKSEPYGAAKAGLKVRVNCIMPGPFLTDISKAWDMDAFNAAASQRIPLGRGGLPHEIVGAALYLASNASSFTTGSLLAVDGGVQGNPQVLD